MALTSAPAGGSLFGALEVVGLPADHATRKGVVLGYRIVGSLRILPAVPKVSLVVGNAKAVRQDGGAAGQERRQHDRPGQRQGPHPGRQRHARSLDLLDPGILPGKTINVPVGKGLSSGSYTATLTLNQRGKRVVNLKKKFRIK